MEKQAPQYKFSDWEGNDKKLQKKNVFNAGSDVLNIKFDPEDTMIAAACSDGHLRVYHLHSGNLKLCINTSDVKDDTTPLTCVKWRPLQYSDTTKNVLVCASADGKIFHYHITTGKLINQIDEKDNQINCLDFNADGTQFVTGGSDNIIRVYDEASLKLEHSLKAVGWKEAGHNNRVFCTKFLPDQPNIVVSGGWDSNVHFWDLRENKPVKSFLGPKISGESIDYKDGKILTGSNSARNQLHIWDFGTCEPIKEIEWDPQNPQKENGAFVYGCQFSKTNDESILAGAHGVNSARIFNAKNDFVPYGSIEGLSQGIYTVDYGNYSNKFAAAGGDGLIFVASLASEI